MSTINRNPVKHQPEPESQESSGAIHRLGAGDETRTRNLLFTRQLRYRLNASIAGKAYLSSESEDSRTTDECRPAAGQHNLARQQSVGPIHRVPDQVAVVLDVSVRSPSVTRRTRPPPVAGATTGSSRGSMRQSANSGAGVG